MANPTTNFGWVMPTSSSLVTNLPADFNTFGQGVDTSMAQLKGGTTGQILSKTSATDMAFTWITNDVGDITAVTAGTGISGGGTSGTVTVTNSMATAITTAGDLIKGTGSGTFDRLGIGSTGQVLTVTAGAPAWATPGGGGKVLQVVNAFTNATVSSSTNVFVTTGLTATITPSSATSKVLIFVHQVGLAKTAANANTYMVLRLLRGATTIDNFEELATNTNTTTVNRVGGSGMTYLDSPATTSAVTYSTSIKSGNNNAAVSVQDGNEYSTITLMEIGA